jgi:endonuclease G, mitochondrial
MYFRFRFSRIRFIPESIRATLEDYKGFGFDRGHLCPAGDVTLSVGELAESFYLSNIVI